MIRSLRTLISKFNYSTVTKGKGFEKRIYLLNDEGQTISFWNDIPLKNESGKFNICIEIPRHQLAKLEVSKDEENHPIVQDTRKNKYTKEKELRSYAQFPLFNYGFFPQTWENSFIETPEGFQGDDDPLDVCDLSSTIYDIGSVYSVRVLGAFCLIDQGEVDWKILTINEKEAQEKQINTIEDFEKVSPHRLNAIKHWFEYIKVFDGKSANKVHYDGKIFGQDKAEEIIGEMHHEWQQLKSNSQQEYQEKAKEYLFIQ